MFRASVAAAALVTALGILAGPAVANAAPFKNCTEARKAGYSNIPATSEYYGKHLDRDGDGIGCESW